MRIAVYCQHVLGMGHLFRTLAIVEALAGHERLLVLGGPPAPAGAPGGVAVVRLPQLAMDADFTRFSLSGPAWRRSRPTGGSGCWTPWPPFARRFFFVELYPSAGKPSNASSCRPSRRCRARGCRVVSGRARHFGSKKRTRPPTRPGVLDRFGAFSTLSASMPTRRFSRLGKPSPGPGRFPCPCATPATWPWAPGKRAKRRRVRRELGVGPGRELSWPAPAAARWARSCWRRQ